MEKTIKELVTDILVEQLGISTEQVVPTAAIIADLGADSLDCVELTMAFEEEFNIEIPDEDAETIKTVQDIVDYLTKRTAE